MEGEQEETIMRKIKREYKLMAFLKIAATMLLFPVS